ncbi:hypothetical protein DFH09DRAFT_1189715 [Mycena vulgaris]|nr:hypothetical protein DFH09DRAFT_1189715 [Mycena vulgaris]
MASPIAIRYYQLINNGIGIYIWPQLRKSSDPGGNPFWDGKNESGVGTGIGGVVTVDLKKYISDTSTVFYLSENTFFGVDNYDPSQKFIYSPTSTMMAVATRSGPVNDGDLIWNGNKPGPSTTQLATAAETAEPDGSDIDLAGAVIGRLLADAATANANFMFPYIGEAGWPSSINPDTIVIAVALILAFLAARGYRFQYKTTKTTTTIQFGQKDALADNSSELAGPVPSKVKKDWENSVQAAKKYKPKDLGVRTA